MIPDNGLKSINTPSGLVKITDLAVGDLVLTHKRRYKKILDIQWEICQLCEVYIKCRTSSFKIADKTTLLTLEGPKIISELNKFRGYSICLAQEISAIEYPEEPSDLFGEEDGQTFCPINIINPADDFCVVYNLITNDNSFCFDGIVILNR